MDVCTIIAKNYLAHARVLARSFARHHPDGRFWTLIIDDFDGYVDAANEPFEVLTPAEIGCEPFIHMAMRYSVLELSTAVKPWLLRHLMGRTGRPVTYLDPDIKIYGSLKPLDDLAAAHGVVLIPHNSEPIPPDDRMPSQVDIMIAGIYNLGYVSLAPGREVEDLLDWWADRLERDCRVDPKWGYFVDQRWFDLAPGFLSDMSIVRDPEFNLAYWNLYSRRVGWADGRYTVNGRPLKFFHFSGFDPQHPLVLSRHQNRVDVTDDPVLEQLLGEYAGDVMGEGHAVSRTWPYSYRALGDGTKIDDVVRALYDEFAEEHHERVASPFTMEGTRAFEAWLGQSAPGWPPGISRALAHAYTTRADLRGTFPDLSGRNLDGLLQWARENGQREMPLLARLDGQVVAPASHAAQHPRLQSPVPLRDDPWGVNLVGFARDAPRLGEEARQVVSALDATGTAVLPIETSAADAAEQAAFPINVLCMDGDLVPEFVREAGEEFVAGRYSVGLWFWDAGRPTKRWLESLTVIDELWAPSSYVARLLEAVATVPVHTVRIPAQPGRIDALRRADVGLPDDQFLFCVGFDDWRGLERANPMAAIAAFRQAFAPNGGARLLLRCGDTLVDGDVRGRLIDAIAEHPDVELIDACVGLSGLIALCDCYVSLHRAEAFGLPIAQAMWLGKPVVATAYSGNLDYMTPENSYLVRSRLVPIDGEPVPRAGHGEWADPDIGHAASLMRTVFDDPDAARQRGATAAEELRLTHSAQTAGELMHRRLESIRATGRARLRADAVQDPPAALSALAMKMRQGPGPVAARGASRSMRLLARKLVLRGIRPYTAEQDQVNAHVLAALQELHQDLNRGIAAVRQTAISDRARQAGELRSFERLPALVESASVGIQQLKSALTLRTDRDIYLAVAELRERHRRITSVPSDPPEGVGLTAYELRAFSQNGEDGVLAEILRRIGIASPFFVEFGVESGREGNCVYLADVAEWKGLFMEGGDEFLRLLERKYAAQKRVRTIGAYVTPDNVEQLFETGAVPLEPDVVSIDVDGQDYWIWEAIESYRPRVLVIEYNSRLDPQRRLVQPNDPERPWDGTDYFGASLGALRALGERKGYRLVHTELSGINAFFVRDDLAPDSFPSADEVAIRGIPNYFQSGYHHPVASPGRRYLDLDSGEFVEPES